MATVRFCSTCDFLLPSGEPCGARSEEYTTHPSCRDCGEDTCEAHQVPDSQINDEGRLSCICISCGLEEAYWHQRFLVESLLRVL